MRFNYWYSISICGLILILSLAGCESKRPRSLGVLDEITVFADDADWRALAPVCRSVFEIEILTPRLERAFVLNRVTFAEFDRYQQNRHLLFVGTLDNNGKTTQAMRQMLNDADLKNVTTGESYLFKKVEPWAFHQLLVVLIAKDTTTLRQKMLANKEFLLNLFEAQVTQRLERTIFSENDLRLTEQNLLTKYGWSLRVPSDFKIKFESSSPYYVILGGESPKRWILVSWTPRENTTGLTKAWGIRYRNQILSHLPGKETIDEANTQSSEVNFQDRVALKLTGLYGGYFEDGWPKVYGGPFRSYFFNDSTANLTYLVDYSLFAPDRDKLMILRELDIIARTFYTRNTDTGKIK
ncbi:DUF4837 family protein [candidate division KSB1 bacterium]|nr:DUF4837 family protein [candidate division KSB1 bacterium]